MAKIPLSPAVGGLPTFYGAYLLNKQQIIESRGWNEVTLKEYESSLVNIICPSIKEHRVCRFPDCGGTAVRSASAECRRW
jgi:hypothetical protein